MSKIEVDEWKLSNLHEWTRRLQQQLRTISGLTQAIPVLFGEVAGRLERLQSTLENSENLLTDLSREHAKTAEQNQQGKSISPGSILSGEASARTISTAGVSGRPGAAPSSQQTPVDVKDVALKATAKRRSGGAGKRNGKSRGSPRLASPAPLSRKRSLAAKAAWKRRNNPTFTIKASRP